VASASSSLIKQPFHDTLVPIVGCDNTPVTLCAKGQLQTGALTSHERELAGNRKGMAGNNNSGKCQCCNLRGKCKYGNCWYYAQHQNLQVLKMPVSRRLGKMTIWKDTVSVHGSKMHLQKMPVNPDKRSMSFFSKHNLDMKARMKPRVRPAIFIFALIVSNTSRFNDIGYDNRKQACSQWFENVIHIVLKIIKHRGMVSEYKTN
jgi:hypothetical protein